MASYTTGAKKYYPGDEVLIDPSSFCLDFMEKVKPKKNLLMREVKCKTSKPNGKVLIGIPLTNPNYYSQFRETVVNAIEAAMQNIENVVYDIFINPATEKKGGYGIAEATNLLVEKCLHEKYDYLWIVEGDVEVPEHAFRKLFIPKADINLGIYPYHRDDLKIMAGYFRVMPEGNPPTVIHDTTQEKLEGKIFTNMVSAGIGCALIKRRVFKNGLRFEYGPELFKVKVGLHDQLFLYEAQRLGFKAFLHGDVICGHLPEWGLDKLALPRLEIGGGSVPLNPGKYVNLDIRKLDTVDVQCHASYLPIRSKAISEIFSEHLIEHLTTEEAKQFATECHRVLNNDGKLRLSTPDFPKLVELYEKHGLTRKIFFKGNVNDTINSVSDFLFSDLGEHGHKSMWDFETLCNALNKQGFSTVTRVNEDVPDRFGRTFSVEIIAENVVSVPK